MFDDSLVLVQKASSGCMIGNLLTRFNALGQEEAERGGGESKVVIFDLFEEISSSIFIHEDLR